MAALLVRANGFVYSADADGGYRLCVFGGHCVDMWRLVHCWYSLGRHVTICTPIVIFAVLTVFSLFLTIGTQLVHCWYSLVRPVTIGTPMVLSVFDDWYSVPFVKNSQNIDKTAKMTISVPIVTCLHRVCRIHKVRVRRIHKAAQTPLPCETSILGAVVQLVEYRTRNREVAGSTHPRSTASNLEQVDNLLCAQANSASYPQRDGKWVVATAAGWRPSVADWGDGVSASCIVGPTVR